MIGWLCALFGFRRELGRGRYALAAPVAFFSQHLVAIALYVACGRTPPLNATMLFFPVRSIARIPDAPQAAFGVGLAIMLVSWWLLASLSFRRALSARIDAGVAALAIVPVLQIPALISLAIAPARPAVDAVAKDQDPDMNWSAITQGVLAGVALTVACVAVGALLFGVYGNGMFVFTPFFVGATTGYIANRRRQLTTGATVVAVVAALALGGAALIAVALEGVVCIVMASPLIALVGLAGGVAGRAIAGAGQHSTGRTAASLAVLPLVFFAERALPPSVTFESAQSIEIAAAPDEVWRSLANMPAITGEPAIPFRLGVAYPKAAEIHGTGVGAERLGVFSTGVAVEQITAWEPGRRLAFEVLENPPAMRELSPYKTVHAPHVSGYFDTTWTAFDIQPTGEGRSRLTVRSEHVLKLDPVLYWLPMAKVVIAADDRRVLRHIRDSAEAS